MHDCLSVKKLTDKQLQDMIMMIGSRMNGVSPYNVGAYELLQQQQDIFKDELIERQMLDQLKSPPLPSMNLTTDALSEFEDVIKDIKKKDVQS